MGVDAGIVAAKLGLGVLGPFLSQEGRLFTKSALCIR